MDVLHPLNSVQDYFRPSFDEHIKLRIFNNMNPHCKVGPYTNYKWSYGMLWGPYKWPKINGQLGLQPQL